MPRIFLALFSFAAATMSPLAGIAQTDTINPGARNEREKSDAPLKKPTANQVLTEREKEKLLPKSQTNARGKDANSRPDANDTWAEYIADLWHREDVDKLLDEDSDQKGRGKHRAAAGVAGFVKQFDDNGDGKLAREELPEQLREGFAAVDQNSDDLLTPQELRRQVHREMTQRLPVVVTSVWVMEVEQDESRLQELQDAYAVLTKIDENSDGQITARELKARQKEVAMNWVDQVFEHNDQDGDNRLSREEARGTGILGRFRHLDDNSDGDLSRKELRSSIEEKFRASSRDTASGETATAK